MLSLCVVVSLACVLGTALEDTFAGVLAVVRIGGAM